MAISTVIDALPEGSEALARECAGQNFFAIDQSLQDLLALYMSDGLRTHMWPHFDRLGKLAGGHLDELAQHFQVRRDARSDDGEPFSRCRRRRRYARCSASSRPTRHALRRGRWG